MLPLLVCLCSMSGLALLVCLCFKVCQVWRPFSRQLNKVVDRMFDEIPKMNNYVCMCCFCGQFKERKVEEAWCSFSWQWLVNMAGDDSVSPDEG